MAGAKKGVITVGATFAPTGGGRDAARAWRLDAGAFGHAPATPPPCAGAGDGGPELVHELLDHWVPGFGLAGVRAEAKALIQFAGRTGADPGPALQALVDGALLRGHCPGEALTRLLPCDLHHHLPRHALPDEEAMRLLRRELGDGLVRNRLLAELVEVGWAGLAPARATWIGRGLDYGRRQRLAEALERVLAWMGHVARQEGWADAHGELAVASDMVRFRFDRPGVWEWAREVRPP